MLKLPSRQRLNALFYYLDGRLMNRVSRKRARADAPAGHANDRGYVQIHFDGQSFWAHRLIWKLIHGHDPECIDHVNGDTSDNRVSNLRSVTHEGNARNRKMPSHNSSGKVGVQRGRANKWKAKIGGESLGSFGTFEEAAHVRDEAEVTQGYHPNHGRGVEAS